MLILNDEYLQSSICIDHLLIITVDWKNILSASIAYLKTFFFLFICL